jgi:hypothetical protein
VIIVLIFLNEWAVLLPPARFMTIKTGVMTNGQPLIDKLFQVSAETKRRLRETTVMI